MHSLPGSAQGNSGLLCLEVPCAQERAAVFVKRTVFEAAHQGHVVAEQRASLAAFRSGAVMGFLLASTGLLVLWITIHAFWLVRTRGCGRHNFVWSLCQSVGSQTEQGHKFVLTQPDGANVCVILPMCNNMYFAVNVARAVRPVYIHGPC